MYCVFCDLNYGYFLAQIFIFCYNKKLYTFLNKWKHVIEDCAAVGEAILF